MIRDIEKELGLDDALALEASHVTVRLDTRRYGKSMTLVDGFDPAVDVPALARELKRHLGTGGTSREGVIELQGDHRKDAADYLRKKGFNIS